MTAFAEYTRFFVFGMARSGLAVSRLLAGDGKRVAVSDDDAGALERFRIDATAAGIEIIARAGAEEAAAQSECVVVSPGVPLDHPVLVRAQRAGVPVIGEIEAAYRYTRARIVGVTGTN